MLQIDDRLASYRIGAGEPWIMSVQMKMMAGSAIIDWSQRRLVLSFYEAGRVLFHQIEGVYSSDPSGAYFAFVRDGRFSESLLGRSVQVELAERTFNGRDIIATGSLSVATSSTGVASFGAIIGRVEARFTLYFTASNLIALVEQDLLPYGGIPVTPGPVITSPAGINSDGTPQVGETFILVRPTGNGPVVAERLLENGIDVFAEVDDLQFTGRVAGTLRYEADLQGPDGTILTSGSDIVVAGRPAANPDPDAIDWSTAAMIGYQTGSIDASSPAAVMRKTFTPAKMVGKATLQVTALGTYIPYMNGTRVGDRELTPGWTDYTKRRHFQTYDVTNLITPGANAVGVEVGDGWAHGYMSLRGRNYYGSDVPRAMVALRLDYADGTSETIVSDASWKATTSDNLANDWYNGSSHDARLRRDWSNPAVSDAAWPNPTATSAGAVPLVKQPSPPARRMETLAPIGRTSPSAGVYIFDFGRNHAGYCTLTVAGATAGQQITLRHAEDLKDDGTLYTANLRAAQATDRFISAGGGTETFEPRHTWHGYRYVEVTGYPGVPPLDCLTSHFVYQDAPLVSSFTTSSPVLKKSWDAAVLAWKSNALTLPTDCPQRDERLGWGADAHLFAQAATFVQDTGAFLDKYCDDLDDSAINGLVGDVAPYVTDVARGRAGWGEAAIIIPWTLYQAYGDTGYISRHWPTMKAVLATLPYVDFYNDYLHLGQPTSPDVFRYAYAYHAADIIKRSADLLGDAATSSTAASKMASFSASWNAFVSGGGSVIGNGAQCGYILGLAFGILPAGQRAAAVSALASRITTDGLKCGFVGLTYLHDVLADGGRLDLAYALAEKTTNPSLGYQLGTGLTTTGEQWDPRGLRGVNDAANSYNHYVRGAVLSWLARSVAGIDAASPGFATVLLRPRPGGAATSAQMTYASKAGTITTDWLIAGNIMTWSFTTPVQAIVSLPPGFVTTGLSGAIAPDPITGGDRYQVAAGTYSITATLTSTYVAAGYVADGYIGAL